MAQIWYLSVETESLEGLEPQYDRPLKDSIELLELAPEQWQCGPDEAPVLKTGNPLVDESGFVYVMLMVTGSETETYEDKRWKPGWYKSPLTLVGVEKNLRKKAK